eukprot:8298791-Pyramimonas_sp.AAC.1
MNVFFKAAQGHGLRPRDALRGAWRPPGAISELSLKGATDGAFGSPPRPLQPRATPGAALGALWALSPSSL